MLPRKQGNGQTVIDRVTIRTLETVAKDKARFVAWLDTHKNTPEKLASEMVALKNSADPRVRMRAVELETKIRGYFESDKDGANVGIQIVIGTPRVVEVKPTEPKS